MSTIAQQAYTRYFSGNEWSPEPLSSIDNDCGSDFEVDDDYKSLFSGTLLKEPSPHVEHGFKSVWPRRPSVSLGEAVTVFLNSSTLQESGFYALALKKWTKRVVLGEISAEKDDPAVRFSELAQKWKAETLYSSSVDEIVGHPAYQEIINMGKDVLPHILRNLEVEGGHWFYALQAITGVNPIAPEDAGRIKKMREAWLCWARQNMIL